MIITRKDVLGKYDEDEKTKCRHWIGTSHHHLPILYKKGQQIYLRSAIYRQHYGEIPKGYRVVMSCDNWDCIQSDHMQLRKVYME